FKELEEVALGVGSDVPFFLSGFSCALVEGRGERIKALSVAPKPILLAQPRGYSVSTKEAYALLDILLGKNGLGKRVPLERVLATLERESHQWGDAFFNDFEKCLHYPEFYGTIANIASKYIGYGSLSGSGSCWYFVGENDKSVVELHRELHGQFLDSVQLWCTNLI
ncbi:MAG TPA: hypothetical protein VJ854_05045, partial [Sphaerochaeta sp.]|nr:hypothetical protein [Sphaerochaeta sp.]